MTVDVVVPAVPSEPHVLTVAGDVDAVTVPELLRRTPELVAGATGLVLDLSRVSFFDSSGVRFADRLARACATSGAGFRVVAPPRSPARRVLEIVGMATLVDDDVEGARRVLAPGTGGATGPATG